jgi:hypothetical protein
MRKEIVNRLIPFALVGCALLYAGCGGSSPGPTDPSSGPTATPTPTPTPAPTPEPTPTPAIGAACANVPDGTGSPSFCSPSSGRHFNAVRDAVDRARGSVYVDPGSGVATPMVDANLEIKAARAYVETIIEALDEQGLCAIFDGEEIQVRDTGADNENYDVITSRGASWINYVTTCNPALPMPEPPATPADKRDALCDLQPSAAYFCVKLTAQLDGPVYAAQDALVAEDRARPQPQIFKFDDKLGGTEYGYLIVNFPGYVSGMIEKLREHGLCAAYDGEEFNVKQANSNLFSENYDMNRFDGYAIRLYNATCRDADF